MSELIKNKLYPYFSKDEIGSKNNNWRNKQNVKFGRESISSSNNAIGRFAFLTPLLREQSWICKARGDGEHVQQVWGTEKDTLSKSICFITVMVVTISLINWLFVTNKPFNSETVAKVNNEKTSSFCKIAILKNETFMMKEGSWLNYVQTAI